MTTSLVFWAFLLAVVGFALAIAEVFLPSGGIIGLSSAICLIVSISLAFVHDTRLGAAFLVGVTASVPIIVGFSFKVLPKTPFGKRIILTGPSAEDLSHKGEELSSLIGQVGRTITTLRPAGITEIDGKRIDTLSEGMVIEQGQLVKVVNVQARRVLVRAVDLDSASG